MFPLNSIFGPKLANATLFRSIKSVKLALILIAYLAVTGILASLVPQGCDFLQLALFSPSGSPLLCQPQRLLDRSLRARTQERQGSKPRPRHPPSWPHSSPGRSRFRTVGQAQPSILAGFRALGRGRCGGAPERKVARSRGPRQREIRGRTPQGLDQHRRSETVRQASRSIL